MGSDWQEGCTKGFGEFPVETGEFGALDPNVPSVKGLEMFIHLVRILKQPFLVTVY